jgi:uncharacterized protein (TIGR03083 family)
VTHLTVVPAIERNDAMQLAREEGGRYLALLQTLTPAQWAAPTDCPPWTVRDMATHVLGNHEGLASLGEGLHQQLAARRRGGNLVDALAAVQVADRSAMSTPQLLERLADAWARSVRSRLRRPGWLRRFRVTVPMRQGNERWSVGYLDDVIYTRDAWMHRLDSCQALGVDPVLHPGHDGRIVATIVQEWADRHGQPYQLSLRGTAGGEFANPVGEGTPARLDLDALEFCRLLSGRGTSTGLLAVEVGY